METDNHDTEGALAGAYVGRIPVRNLWLLMLYASDVYKTAGGGNVALEEDPEDLPDTVARILADVVTQRLRRQLSAGYMAKSGILNRVRGRIDVLATERHQLLERGMVACRFEELTADTPRNRFVRAALQTIATLVRRRDLARQCTMLASKMQALGVTGSLPTRAQMSAQRYGRHDAQDRMMVDAARLAFDLMLPTEKAGAHALPLPDREGPWVRKLFERAVGGFYAVHLAPAGWHVVHSKPLAWQVSTSSPGVHAILPGMNADIVLDDPQRRRRIVIDTKFNAIVTPGRFRETTLRNGYLYQIYSYLRSQAGGGDPLADTACGMLLHPAVDGTVDEWVKIQDHLLRFATVDLTADAAHIRRRLLDLCNVPDPVQDTAESGPPPYTSPVR